MCIHISWKNWEKSNWRKQQIISGQWFHNSINQVHCTFHFLLSPQLDYTQPIHSPRSLSLFSLLISKKSTLIFHPYHTISPLYTAGLQWFTQNRDLESPLFTVHHNKTKSSSLSTQLHRPHLSMWTWKCISEKWYYHYKKQVNICRRL